MPKFSYVTICVNYLDYFKITFAHNREEFDEVVVITSAHDKDTQEFCKQRGVTCVVTNTFYANGAKFNCGGAINDGLSVIASRAEWTARMDCDVFVPKEWRSKLPALETEMFYGAQRVLLNTADDYHALLAGKPETDFEIPLGIGYGFFQMFHFKSTPMRNKPFGQWYPSFPICDEVDWMFRNQWGDHYPNDYTRWFGNLEKLPFNVYHLGPHGQNHEGRKSKLFSL